jgi:hypothetical protein
MGFAWLLKTKQSVLLRLSFFLMQVYGSIFNVRLRICARRTLGLWWYRDQFAKLLNTAFRLNHPVKAIRFRER